LLAEVSIVGLGCVLDRDRERPTFGPNDRRTVEECRHGFGVERR
jgi:hypothetical protein